MRTRRILAAFAAPLVIVACATGTPPVGSSSDGEGGVGSTGSDASYGADDTGSGGSDSGSTDKDSGITRIDSGGGGGIDSGGGGGGGGGDCDNSGGGSFFYNLYCEEIGPDAPCTPGGTDCDSFGDCCFNDPSSDCYSDYGGAVCVPP